jgi:predicted AlkP superfamily pyrophosphatase or phosphodiesterase
MKKRMPRAKHVVLISVDGLQPTYYLDDKWPAPAMQQLYREGAHAVAVKSVFPALTYPAHTTLVTGALPARHGICHNKHFEPVTDPPWLKDASLIRVPALWDAVRARGGTTGAVLWPLTAGAAIDWNLPDIWPGGDGDLMAALRGHDQPRGLIEELEREATGRLSPENFNNQWLTHDLRVALLAEYLFERYRPTLLLVHTQTSNQVPQEPDWRNPRRARSVAASDQIVSIILEVLERTKTWEGTAVIVTGDHGNTEVHSQIRPNVWLVEAGLRGRRLEQGDWRATFHALGGSAFLRVRDDDAVAAVRRVLDGLPAAVRQLLRFVEREELETLGADPEAPFALAAASGFVIDDRSDPPDLQPNPGMSHGHHNDLADMNTGFIAKGAGIRAGACAPLLPLTAIAPLVAELLDLDFHAPDGVLYPGLLTE